MLQRRINGGAAAVRMTVRFGRLAGIEVGANWSVLVILILVAESLAAGLLPAAVPGRSALTYWATATTVAVLLLGCLLAHELAHAVVARRAGVRVEGITLWMLGGVTRLTGEPATARADLAVAAAGPATSLALGALLLGAAAGLSLLGIPARSEPSVALAGLAWLGWINLILAVFNLLPGAPLDGGRILRALLWWRGRDRVRAAVAATRAGAVLGVGLVALGVAAALAGDAVGGLWLALIGWFLVAAAGQERRDTLLRSALAGVTVGEVMTPDPDCAPSWLTVDAFAAGLAPARQHRSYPLLDINGRVVAVVTLRQLSRRPAGGPGDHQAERRRDAAGPRPDRTAARTAGRGPGPARHDGPRAAHPGPRRRPPRRHPHPHRRDPRHAAGDAANPARCMNERRVGRRPLAAPGGEVRSYRQASACWPTSVSRSPWSALRSYRCRPQVGPRVAGDRSREGRLA